MNFLDIAIQREINDEKLIDDYEKEATNEWENSSTVNIPGAWSFFYLADCGDNSLQEIKKD